MHALQILLEEHQSLAAILHAIRYMLKEIGAGRVRPDLLLIRAMVHYLEAYPEQRHHPREDRFLFARLKDKTDEGKELLDQLFAQHAGAGERIKALEDALDVYERDLSKLAPLAAAFGTYADFYRSHMLLEEREILPLLRKHFTEQDWAEIDAELAAEGNNLGGMPNENFSGVFSKLVAMAPEPIGLGMGPYKD